MAQIYTGMKGWTTLEQYNTYTGLPTGVEKPNTPDQAEYVAPVESAECTGEVPTEVEVTYYAHVQQYGARDWEITLKDKNVFGEGAEVTPPIEFSFPLSWKVDHGEADLVVLTETLVLPTTSTSIRTSTPTTADIIACLTTTPTGVTIGAYTVLYVYSPDITSCTV